MLNRDPDKLFRRFATRGDVDSLARVFDLVAPRLLQVARHLARDPAEAEDVVQETFLLALERPERWDGSRPLVPWMLGILSNVARAGRRRAGRVPEPERLSRGTVPDPEADLEQNELREAVQSALQELPETYRAVLVRHLVEGERPRDIARSLGRSVGTVRVQLHRGLKRMRGALPAGFAAGTVLVLAPERALAAARVRVLEHALEVAKTHVPHAASVSSGSFLLGGLAVSKKLAITALTLLLFVSLGAVLMDSPEPTEPVSVTDAGGEAKPAAPEGARGLRAADSTTTRSSAGPGSGPTEAPESEQEERLVAASAHSGRMQLVGSIATAGGEPLPPVKLLLLDTDWVEVEVAPDGSYSKEISFVPMAFEARAEGYAPARYYRWDRPKMRVALDSGATFDMGEVEIEKGLLLGGRVVREGGAPVPHGTPVFLMRYHYTLSRDQVQQGFGHVAAQTDEEGRFQLAERVPFSGGHVYDYLLFAGGADGLGWSRVGTLEGGDDSADVGIVLGGHGELVVEVFDRDGEPASGVGVELAPDFPPLDHFGPLDGDTGWGGDTRTLAELFSRRTDAQGRAGFAALPFPAGEHEEVGARYRVHVRAAGKVRTVELDPLRPTLLRIDLAPSGLAIAGHVRAAGGEVLEGARVELGDAQRETDASGNFSFSDVTRADEVTLRLTASAAGFAPESRVIDPTSGVGEAQVFELVPAEALMGRVVDQHGEPVEDAGVHVSRLYSEVQEGAPHEQRNLRTEADGVFAFDDLRPGRWQVSVHPPYESEEFRGIRRAVFVAGERDAEVVLERVDPGIARVVADVVDAVTGQPLDVDQTVILPRRQHPGIDFALPPRPRRLAGRVVADGVRAGAWRLWVGVEGRDPAHVDFDVAEGEREVVLEVRVGERGRVRGRVEVVDGLEPEHMRVALLLGDAHGVPGGAGWGDAGTTSATLEVAEDGSFELEGVHPGRWSARLHHFSHYALLSFEVAPGEVADVLVRPLPGARVELAGPTPPEREGWAPFSVEHESGWTSGPLYGRVENGEFTASVLVPPGASTWSGQLPLHGAAGGAPTEIAEGSFFAALGARTRVPVSWIPAD